MANGFSTYLSQAIINGTLVTPTFPLTRTLYLAYFTSDPTDANITANEVAGAWYVRQPTGAWSAPTGSAISSSNSNQIQFPAVTGSAVTISHWGIYDLSTGGNLLFSGTVGTAKTFNVGDVIVVSAGQLVITID
jgi:hypothetical protein